MSRKSKVSGDTRCWFSLWTKRSHRFLECRPRMSEKRGSSSIWYLSTRMAREIGNICPDKTMCRLKTLLRIRINPFIWTENCHQKVKFRHIKLVHKDMFFLFKCLCLSSLFLKCINEGIGSFVEKKIQFVSFYILSTFK